MLDINFSSVTLEDLDHPRLKQFYSIYWDITLGITTIFFFLMLYTVIKKSTKEMGGYKWYLCHQLFWSYIFELFVSLWKPIPLWPFYLGYSGGFLSNLPGKYSFKVLFVLATFMGFSIGISIVHRYVQASPFSLFYQMYNNCFYRFFVYFFIILHLQGGFYYFLTYMPEIETLQSSILSQNPIMKVYFEREKSLFGFDPATDNNYTIFIQISTITVLLLFLIFLAFLYFNFIRIMRKNKILMSAGTYKLQKILFKTLYIQICLVTVVMVVPLTASLMLALFGVKWTSTFTLFGIMLISTHALADFFTMVYFIKPYRIFIIGLIKTLLKKFGIKFNSAMVQPIVASSSGMSIGGAGNREHHR